MVGHIYNYTKILLSLHVTLCFEKMLANDSWYSLLSFVKEFAIAPMADFEVVPNQGK